MPMHPSYSLAYLTYAPLGLPEAVTMAARLGYDAIGTRIASAAAGGAYCPVIEDPALLRNVRARLADTGLRVFDVEIVRLGAGFQVGGVAALLEAAGELGARAVLVAGDDPDEERLTASYASFCDAALDHGLTADLEFMPWTRVPDARSALRIVDRADRPNGRVLVDALHWARSATTPDDVAAIPRARLGYAQLCDAPGAVPTTDEGLIHTARCARLLPGEGDIDLSRLLSVLPADLPLSLEIPNDERIPQVGPERWSRDALASAKALVARRSGPARTASGEITR